MCLQPHLCAHHTSNKALFAAAAPAGLSVRSDIPGNTYGLLRPGSQHVCQSLRRAHIVSYLLVTWIWPMLTPWVILMPEPKPSTSGSLRENPSLTPGSRLRGRWYGSHGPPCPQACSGLVTGPRFSSIFLYHFLDSLSILLDCCAGAGSKPSLTYRKRESECSRERGSSTRTLLMIMT